LNIRGREKNRVSERARRANVRVIGKLESTRK
jgi:hypothetical protein